MAERDVETTSSDQARSAFVKVNVPTLQAQQIHRFVVGLDGGPRPMTAAEVEQELRDPFAELLLRRGVFPATVHEVLGAMDAAVGADHPLASKSQASFIVGEGSQIPWSQETAHISRGLRLIVTRGQNNLIDLLISTGATGEPSERFLQVMGWDEDNGVFHYYERRNQTWVWAGNSFHALDPRSRGRGPFDSHVNGAMVFKELKFPWVHWHSVAATVPPEVFEPGDAGASDPLFTNASGAEFLETAVVIPGIERWTTARLAKTLRADGTVEQVPQLMEQLFVTTTINLISSPTESRAVDADADQQLPATFFVDSDTLSSGEIGLQGPPAFTVSGRRYLDSLETFDVALVEGDFRQPGDTHFAFLVPERAFEDLSIVRRLVQEGVLSSRFVACALMIDFSNPVFSPLRAALLVHAPATGRRSEKGSDLEATLVAAIEAAAQDSVQNSAENEFLANWQLGEAWRSAFDKRLTAYYDAIARRLNDDDGFRDMFRLAESRRRRVREHDISEGRPLLFAETNIPKDTPHLRMLPDATVGQAG